MEILKSLLKKSINFGASALLLVSTLLPTLGMLPSQTASAQTNAPTTGGQALQPTIYDTYDTGNHAYSGEQNNTSYYNIGGNDNPTITGNWFNLVNNHTSKVGFAVFKGAILTSQSFTLSSTMKVQGTALVGAQFSDAGDSTGFILTPSSVNQLQANIPNATGPNLGITGLSNTYFLGRDLYFNSGSSLDGSAGTLGTGWQNGGSDEIAIRNTLLGGTLNPASYSSSNGQSDNNQPTTTNGQAWMRATDDSYALGVDSGVPATVQEPITVSWTPDATNSAPAGYNSGTLSFKLTAQTTSNGLPSGLGGASVNGGSSGYTLQTKCVLQNSMSIGYVGATGGNYGNLSISLNGASGALPRGSQPAKVNYINAVTGKKISALPSSTIIANVGDRVGVVAPDGTVSSTVGLPGLYQYSAPLVPTGYTAYSKVTYGGSFDTNGVLSGDSASDPNDSTNTTSSLTIANVDANATTNANSINVYYTPQSVTSHLYQALAANTPGSYTLTDSQIKSLGGSDFTGFASSTGSIGWSGNPGLGSVVSGTNLSGLSSNTPLSLTGATEGTYTYPSLTVPTGYSIDKIYYQNTDNTWTTYSGTSGWAQLQTDHPQVNASPDTILVTYAPLIQSPTLSASFVGRGTIPSNFVVNFQDESGNSWQAPTGSLIPTDVISATDTALNNQVANYSGWYCASYIDPLVSNMAASLSDAVANANGVVNGSNNNYQAILNYQGTISLSVPSIIDFGTHTISGNTQNLTGQMEDNSGNAQGVIVTDGRATPDNGNLSWTLNVEQSQPLTSPLGLSFSDSFLSYNGTAMTLNSPLLVASDENSSTGKITEVLKSDSKSFTLLTPNNLQVPNASYQGGLTWTLITAP